MKANVIFLNVEDVLTSDSNGINRLEYSNDSLNHLNELCNAINGKVVLIGSHRYELTSKLMKKLLSKFESHNIKCVGTTLNLNTDRETEITDFLNSHKEYGNEINYIIIDNEDVYHYQKNHTIIVKPNLFGEGLCEDYKNQAIELFNKLYKGK